MKKYTQKEKVAFIRKMITTNADWSKRALLKIFENQTTDEQLKGETNVENGIGFNGIDANILTSFAKSLMQYNNLTSKQMTCLYKMIGKYAMQIYRMSNEEKLIKAMEKYEVH